MSKLSKIRDGNFTSSEIVEKTKNGKKKQINQNNNPNEEAN